MQIGKTVQIGSGGFGQIFQTVFTGRTDFIFGTRPALYTNNKIPGGFRDRFPIPRVPGDVFSTPQLPASRSGALQTSSARPDPDPNLELEKSNFSWKNDFLRFCQEVFLHALESLWSGFWML